MDSELLASPKPPPELHIPKSECTVDVRVIDTKTTVYLNPELFWQPKIQGFQQADTPTYSFLISRGDKHVVFDLGVRNDWENYAPKTVDLIKATTRVERGPNVASVLDSDESGLNVRAKDIQSVIWSHNHFDHIGDPSTFPKSTELIVGPGVKAASWPGYPSNPDAIVLDSDIEDRNVREIAFTGLKLGRFDAMDFFGDGSFYLLNAPGHAVGHICGLARTTAYPPTFIFMGADACHHPGVLRPTDYLPIPCSVPVSVPPGATCPGALLEQLTLDQTATSPFFEVGTGSLFPDRPAALETVSKMQEFDAENNILMLIAHDLSVRETIPLFPKKINDWKLKHLRWETRWLFCKDFQGALRSWGLGSFERQKADDSGNASVVKPDHSRLTFLKT